MPVRSHTAPAGPLPLIALVGLLAAGGALLIAKVTPAIGLGAGLLLVVLFASFLNAELALHIILLSMLLSPEILVGSAGGVSIGKPMHKGDALVLRIEDLILTIVAFGWLARMAVFKELGVVRRTPLNLPMLAYITAMVLATLVGVLFGHVRPLRGFFYTLKYFEYFVVFFMTVNYVRDERQLKRLLATTLVTAAISAVMGILQIPGGGRVGAPFEGRYGEPNTFGGYLVLMLALVLGHVLTTRGLVSTLGWTALAGLFILPLLYTLSRSSWLAAVPMLLVLVVWSPRRLLLLTALGLLVISAPFVMPRQVVDRYNYTLAESFDRGHYSLAGARLDTSTSARLDSWRQGVEGWMDSPSLGYGVTGFHFMDAQFVRVLVEGGLAGLLTFLWMLSGLVRIAFRTTVWAAGTRFHGLALGHLAGVAAMLAHCVGANTFIIVRIMEPFWFLTALIVLLPGLSQPVPGGVAPLPSAPQGGRPGPLIPSPLVAQRIRGGESEGSLAS